MSRLIALACVGLMAVPGVPPQSSAGSVETEAVRVLADDTASFSERTALVDKVDAALRLERDAETAGRLALLWMRLLRRALGGIPIGVNHGSQLEPYAAWLGAHEREVIYNEPGGEWVVANAIAWQLHDAHRTTTSAESLAWEIVENGLAGECEGYPPCYLAGLDVLHSRYLREHPGGDHAEQAVAEIHESLDQIQRLLAGPDARDFFNPATDCKDLVPGADSLRRVLAAAKVETTATRRALKAIRDKC